MNKLRSIRKVLWVLALLASVGLVVLLEQNLVQQAGYETIKASDIGGPFILMNHRGQVVTEQFIQGKPSLMFFGFTMCPQVCPSTLADMTRWLKVLGPDADQLNAVFVTVDPERDTQQQLANYLHPFDKRIVGLTGTAKQITAITKAYRIYVKKVPLDDGDYTVDHTGAVYLLDTNGKFVGSIDYQEDDAIALPKIRRLIEASKGSNTSP